MAKTIINPELRFAGFAEDWKEEKLLYLADFSKGHGYSKKDLTKKGNPILMYGRLYTNYQTVIKSVETFVNAKSVNVLSNGGEVVIPASGETQEDIIRASVVEQKNIILGGDLNIVVPKDELNSVFLALTISNGKVYKDLVKKAQGKSVVHIRNNDLSDSFIPFPNKDEQKLIGNFFENIDKLITEHQQKHSKLKALKLAMLDKMFPKQGQLIPEIRFKGFEGDWKEYEVGKIFKVTRGNVLAASKLSKTKSDVMQYPVYSSQTTNNGLLGYYDDYLFEDAITWTTDGANAGTVNFRKGKFYSTNVNGVLLSDEGFANTMVAEAINKLSDKYVSRVGNPKLMNNVMSQIKIVIPNSIDEQNLISRELELMDNVKSQHEMQITKLQNIKKAFLAKMFI